MKKKIAAAASLIVLVLACIIFNNFFAYGFFENKLVVSYPSKINLTQDDGALVVDSGGKRVVRLCQDGSYSLQITAGADTFSNATNAVADAAGDIYITDVQWAANGMDIAKESILRFDRYGKLKGSIVDRQYETRMPRARIFGIYLARDAIYAIEVSPEGFTLLNVGGTENIPVETVEYKDADVRISSFAVDGESIFFVDKQGVVYESTGGKIKPRYENDSSEISVPWQVAVDGSNCLYISDIAKRQVIKIAADNKVTSVFDKGEGLEEQVDFAETPIYYPVSVSENGNVGTVYFDNVFIKNANGDIVQNSSEFGLAKQAQIWKIVWIGVMALMAAIAIYLLICGAIALSKRNTWKLSTKLGLAIVFVIAITMIIVLPITYAQGKSMYVESSLEHLSAVVDMGGNFLDTEALAKINSPMDYMSEDYLALYDSMKLIVNKEQKHSERLYCLLYQVKDGILYSPMFLDGTGGAYYPYDYTAESSNLREVFDKGKIVETELSSASSGTWMYVQGPIYDKNQNIVGAIEVGLDMFSYQESYNKMYMQIILSVIAAAVILQMIFMQILGMGDFFKRRKEQKITRKSKEREPIEFVGPLTFLLFFAFNLITAFIPVYSMKMYIPVSGLPTSFMQALPISMNLLAVVVGCAFSGTLIHKYGIQKSGIIGSVIAVVAYVALGFLQNYFGFTIMFVIAGVGTGIVQNTVSTYIATTKDPEEQARGFTAYNSALFVGFNCGTVLGSLIAEKMGYKMVFTATAIFFLLTGILMVLFVRAEDKSQEEVEKKKYNIFKFVFKPKIFLFFLCAVIPFTVSNHFLFYFMPVYGESMGLSESLVGQMFLINGICVLLLSDFLTKITTERMKNRTAIFIALCIVGGAFVLFSVNQSLGTMIGVLILLGIASGFGASALRTYYTSQKQTKLCGEARAMGAFATIENVGDTIGPIVFSFILSGVLRTNYFGAAMAVFGLAVVFFLSSQSEPGPL